MARNPERVYIPPDKFLNSRKTADTKATYEKVLILFSKWKFNTTDLTTKGPLGAYVKKGDRSDILGDLLLYSKYLEEPRVLENGEQYTLSKATRKAYITGLKAYLTMNEITFNKGQLNSVTVKNDEEVMDETFTHETAKAVFDQLTIPARAIFLFLLSSGGRVNEVLNVNVDDVEWNTHPCKVHLRITKGGRARDVYITDECRDYLQSVWLASVTTKNGETLPRRDQYLISKENKGFIKYKTPIARENDKRLFPVTRNTFQNMLRRALINCGYDAKTPTGIMKLHVHSTRKYFRSQVGRWGSPDVAEHLLGHSYGLAGTYRKFKKDDPQLVKDFQKAAPYLEINHTKEARSALQSKEEQAISIAGLQAANAKMQQKIQQLEERDRYITLADEASKDLDANDIKKALEIANKRMAELEKKISAFSQ